MPLPREAIAEQNPWWTRRGWEADDAHLEALAGQPSQLPAPVVERIDLGQAGIHIIRGPRQVGKSTALKLLVKRALSAGWRPEAIAYLTLDTLEDHTVADVAATIELARELAGPPGSALLLLDEVTAVPSWQTAVKHLWDAGPLREDVVVCTGSSAIDLRSGAADRLPGRRGQGDDHLVLPHTFADFAPAVNGVIPPSPRLTVERMTAAEGRRTLERGQLHMGDLRRALDLYMRFGGLPAAVAEAASGQREPSRATRRIFQDSLLREVQRKGASVPALRALLERVLRSLGSKTAWSKLALEMGVPLAGRRGRGKTSYQAVRDYIEFLAAAYFILIVYFWRRDADTGSVSNDKKIYLGDPLLHTVAHEYAPGLPVDEPALVENIVALALYRSVEPAEYQIESFAFPDRLHAWQTRRGGEIDFVCGPRDAIAAVEVKYRQNPKLTSARALAQAFPGRPAILVTKDALDFRDEYALIPAPLFLWALS